MSGRATCIGECKQKVKSIPQAAHKQACLCNWFGSIPHHRPCWCPWTNSLQTSANNAAATGFALENWLRILWGCYCLLPNASKCYPPCHCMRHILRKANEQEMVSLVSLAVQNRPWFWVTWILKPTLCWLCVLSFSERRECKSRKYQDCIKVFLLSPFGSQESCPPFGSWFRRRLGPERSHLFNPCASWIHQTIAYHKLS